MEIKILTLEQLVSFCEQNQLYSFDSKQVGAKLCVQIPSTFEIEKDEYSSMMYLKVKLLHTGLNRNHSNVTKEAAEKCLSTIKYKPILADFCEIDGVRDFTSHSMEINDDGTINYIERQVGSFTSDKPTLEYDEETDRYYIYARAAIPREYTDTADIIERKNGSKISAEIFINQMSFDSKNKELLLEDIEVLGGTLLGTDPKTGKKVEEGMEGARVDIESFSVPNETKIQTLNDINDEIDTIEEGGIKVDNENKFEEEVTETVENEEEVTVEEKSTEEVTDTEEYSESTEETSEEEVSDDNTVEFTLKDGRTFSLSLNDKIMAVYTLVNETYGESDNDYYDCVVFDENVVEMHGLFTGKSYRQNFKVKKDVYSLVGDRVSIYSKWMTQDEINAFEQMKSSFEETSSKLAKYEAEPEKIALLESNDYKQVADSVEFMELAKKESHFDLTIDELRQKADEILLNYAKNGNLNFAAVDEKKPIEKKTLPTSANKKESRYGNLFAK